MKSLVIYISFVFLILTYSGKGQCNLDSIGLNPTQAEINNVFLEWGARDHSVYNWQIISDNIIDSSRIIIASHEIEGFTHYGLIRLPFDTSLLSCPLPVLVYLHGGLNGLFLHKINILDNYFPSELLRDSLIIVAPSFRSEQLYIDSVTSYYSGGPSTEMDKDADDAITFLNGAIENFNYIDTTRISLIGFSRGGNVAYKVAIRNPMVKAMNVFFSATNIFDPLLIADAKNTVLTSSSPQYIVNNICINDAMNPYCDGIINMTEARKRMITWSPAHFAENLPRTNAFHGTLDPAIPVSQSYYIDSVLNYNNPGATNYQFFEYPNAGHSMSSMTGFEQQAIALIREVITPPVYYENDSLTSNGEAPSYQWYWNNFPVSGATESKLSPLLPGQYKLEFILANGCSYFSKSYDWLITGNQDLATNNDKLYFNSLQSEIIFISDNTELYSQITIHSSTGQLILKETGIIDFPYSIYNLKLNSGIYIFTIRNKAGLESLKFFIN